MGKISKDLVVGNLHPRENIFGSGSLAAANAEVLVLADGAMSVSLDVRGTYTGTIIVEGTVDGTNYTSIPMRPLHVGNIYVLTLASAAVGNWIGNCAGFKQVRARMSAFTSGSATTIVVTTIGASELISLSKPADLSVTVTAAAASSATCTLPSATGMFHYITRIVVNKFASALLTAGATPVLVTTTNLPGSRVLSFAADAALQGTLETEIIEPSAPLKSSTVNTNTTIVGPATTAIIWRITTDYYLAP